MALKSAASKIFSLFYCSANREDVKDKQNMKLIVVLAIAIAVVFGVLLIAYCICKRKTLRGNVTFFYPLWKKISG